MTLHETAIMAEILNFFKKNQNRYIKFQEICNVINALSIPGKKDPSIVRGILESLEKSGLVTHQIVGDTWKAGNYSVTLAFAIFNFFQRNQDRDIKLKEICDEIVNLPRITDEQKDPQIVRAILVSLEGTGVATYNAADGSWRSR